MAQKTERNRETGNLTKGVTAAGLTDVAALRQAEQAAAIEWKPGDVILDLYEVRRVTEGFGEDAIEKDYHEGGFGRVYKVWHRDWQLEMAVKAPRPGMFNSQVQKDTFIKECETWINLGLHPHIAACHYVRELGGAPRVFSEYANAGTLEDWIRSGRLYEGDPKEVLARMLDAAIQFAWGLHYAHEQGVVHQDVKPLNALMWNDGTLKVTDFGIANARQRAGVSMPGEGMGTLLVSQGGLTPAYCSPEQARAEKLSRRTDVWSWALSVLQMFQGEVTWQSGTLAAGAMETFLKHNGEEESIPPMPAGVVDLLRQCFLENADDRPKIMFDCAAAMLKVYESETGEAYPRPEPKPADAQADGLNNRALSFLDLGKPEETERLLDEALRLHPGHFQASYNRGLMFWRAGRVTADRVFELLRDQEQSSPKSPQVAVCRGWVERERADFSAAAEHFQKAVGAGGGVEADTALELAKASKEKSLRCLRTIEGHTGWVNAVCISADGRWALSGSSDHTIKLWDLATGACLRTFEGHRDVVESLCLSGDGRWAMSAGWDKTLRLWEVATGACLRTFEGHTSYVYSVCFSTDANWVLSGSADNTVRLWEVATGSCVRTFNEHRQGVRCVCLSADGRWALSGSADKTLKLWDLATGQCLRTFEGNTGPVISACLSRDGRWALSGCQGVCFTDKMLKLWDIVSGQCLSTFEGHSRSVRSVHLSADERWVLSGSEDNTLKLWTATGQLLRTFEAHTNIVTSACLSVDGRWALSGSGDKTVKVWDMQMLACHDYHRAPFLYCRVMTTRHALDIRNRIATGIEKGTELLRSGQAGQALHVLREVRSLPGGERDRAVLELWHRIGRRLRRKGFIAAWLSRKFDRPLAKYEVRAPSILSVCLSMDGRLALSGTDDRRPRLWDVASGTCIHAVKGRVSYVAPMCLSADGNWALSGVRHDCEENDDGFVSRVFGTDDLEHRELFMLWDPATGQCLQTFEGHTKPVGALCLSADGRRALSGSRDKTVKLWDVATGRCMRTFGGHTNGIGSVCLSADGRWALSGGEDKTLRLWDVATGRCIQIFEGHANGVGSVCLSVDGRWALSGSGDKTLKLWDVATGQCLWTFEGHSGAVTSVCLSADGRWALSGSTDGTPRLWELDWDYEEVEPADWDEGARPHVTNFLTLSTPYAANVPLDRTPSEEEVTKALTRWGRPSWTQEGFQRLLETLADAGYGWVCPEGVGRELEKMARDNYDQGELRSATGRKSKQPEEERHGRAKEEQKRSEGEERRRTEEVAPKRDSLWGRVTGFLRGNK